VEYPLDENFLKSMTQRLSKYGAVELVWMSPEEFLSQVPHPATALIPAVLDLRARYFSKTSLGYIRKAIMTNRKLPPLILDYTSMWGAFPRHEGRSRAFISKQMGIQQIPVLVVRK